MGDNEQHSIGRAAPDFYCGDTITCGERSVNLRPSRVMGILNITPDSFSDGGELCDARGVLLDKVIQRAATMLDEGADILDVGGESTRPGAAPVASQQEIERVAPVVEALARRFDTVISIDTSNPSLMAQAAALGAGMINDVRALRREGAMQAASASGLPVCLMHMQGEPGNMQHQPCYDEVVSNILHFLQQRIDECIGAGIARDKIIIDPGFGFGKTLEHNLQLFRKLPLLVATRYPVLVGVSRKSMIAAVTGRAVKDRAAGGLALASLAASQGVAILRAHDVAQTRDAVAMVDAVMRAETR